MLTRDDVVLLTHQMLIDTDLKEDEYIIVYGGAMVLRDLKRNCNDIDITVAPEAFDRISNKLGLMPVKYSKEKDHFYIHFNDDIDLFRGAVGCATEPIGTIVPGTHGLVVQTLESLRDEKLKRGRDKDIVDLTLIKNGIEKEKMIFSIKK